MSNKYLRTLFLLFFCPASIFSQPVFYQHQPAGEQSISPAQSFDFSGSLDLSFRTEGSLKNISFNSLLGLEDEGAARYPSLTNKTSDWLAKGSLLLPVMLIADEKMRGDVSKISVLLSETIFVANGITFLSKRLLPRDEPSQQQAEISFEEKLNPPVKLSFFSGHTSMTASLSFFSARIWSDYHPDSKLKPLVWTAAAALPAVTGYLRCKTGEQNYKELAAGYAVGALVGYFVPRVHKVDTRSRSKFRVSSTIIGNTPVFIAKYRF